jgi:hypothetical protein
MRLPLAALCLSSVIAYTLAPARVLAAEVDARPPDRLTLSGSRSTFVDADDEGGGGSLNYLHYFTPNVIFGLGGEHQFVEDAKLTFGSLRGAMGWGEPASRTTIAAEVHYGDGDDNGREFDYAIGVLALSQSFTSKFSVQLETREIDIDTSRGNLPKLGLSYVWSPHFVTQVGYAHSVGGNLGTELFTGRMDYYGKHLNLMLGGSSGRANPAVLVLQPGVVLPASNSKQGFLGIGKTFRHGEVMLMGDYLEVSGVEKVTATLSFTAYLGSRGRAP